MHLYWVLILMWYISMFGVLHCETDIFGVGKFGLVGVMELLRTGVAPEQLTVVLFT